MTRKKYRPFTNEEFIELFDLGKFHSIRKIDELYDRLIITNIYHSKDNYLYISLTGDDNGYGLYWFFKKCEYFDGEWKPFGVLVEDEL